MNKLNRNRQNSGITLIALVITIIVMLILVAVTVNVAINGGLFGEANKAATGTEEKAIYDQIVSAMVLDKNGKINVAETFNSVEAMFGNKLSDETWEGNTEVTFKVTGKKGTYKYTILETEIEMEGTREKDPEEPQEPEQPKDPIVFDDPTVKYRISLKSSLPTDFPAQQYGWLFKYDNSDDRYDTYILNSNQFTLEMMRDYNLEWDYLGSAIDYIFDGTSWTTGQGSPCSEPTFSITGYFLTSIPGSTNETGYNGADTSSILYKYFNIEKIESVNPEDKYYVGEAYDTTLALKIYENDKGENVYRFFVEEEEDEKFYNDTNENSYETYITIGGVVFDHAYNVFGSLYLVINDGKYEIYHVLDGFMCELVEGEFDETGAIPGNGA